MWWQFFSPHDVTRRSSSYAGAVTSEAKRKFENSAKAGHACVSRGSRHIVHWIGYNQGRWMATVMKNTQSAMLDFGNFSRIRDHNRKLFFLVWLESQILPRTSGTRRTMFNSRKHTVQPIILILIILLIINLWSRWQIPEKFQKPRIAPSIFLTFLPIRRCSIS